MKATRQSFLLFALIVSSLLHSSPAQAQTPKKITAFDFELPLKVQSWWVDNKDIRLTQCDRGNCYPLPNSGHCLRVQWDSVPAARPFTWMTDIKIDVFGDSAAAAGNGPAAWKDFGENTWLSFSLNTAAGDSVYLQFIVFTKGEKDKWGSHMAIGIKSPVWKTVKVKLSSLQFDNWGKGNSPEPDLRSIIPSRIEIGLRSPQTARQAKIDVRVDNIVVTNDEP